MGKRKNNWYKRDAYCKKRKQDTLNSGVKGFLVTCSNKNEKHAKREMYNILNEYANRIYGPENSGKEVDVKKEEADVDIEKDIKQEVESLKGQGSSTARRFQAVQSGANNCLFIKTTLEEPDHLLEKILEDMYESKERKSRYIMKVFPVIGTCRCEEEKLKKFVCETFPEIFKGFDSFTYCFLIKVRNNSQMTRHKMLDILNDAFTCCEEFKNAKVEFENPDVMISIDVFKSICCVSVLRDFKKYKKYNLQEICEEKPEKCEEKSEICEEKPEKCEEKSEICEKKPDKSEEQSEKCEEKPDICEDQSEKCEEQSEKCQEKSDM